MNILIKDALALLPGEETRVCDVYVSGDTIASIDKAPEGFEIEKTIDGTGRLLTPGFVNAHTHIYMTSLRNRADDLNFMTWLFDNVMPMESKLTDEDAYWSVQLGCMEMLQSGVTSIMDMHMFPHTTPKALEDAGMRAVVTRGLTGDKDSMDEGKKRIEQALLEYGEFKNSPIISFRLAPHAPYTCDEGFLRLVAETARENGLGIHTHLSESMDEQKTIKERYGCTPAEYFDRCGILTENTLCAHCVYISESDMELLARRGTSVAHNAASNMKLGNGFAPVPEMLKHGINVALGTDGCCSNNNQSILKEMQMASLIHKGVAREATTLPAKSVFDMATVNGAKALGLGGVCGEIKVGCKADLALFNLDTPELFPLGEPKAALCYSSAGLKAETVLVNGRILLEKGEYKTIDVERLKMQVKQTSERLNEIYRK